MPEESLKVLVRTDLKKTLNSLGEDVIRAKSESIARHLAKLLQEFLLNKPPQKLYVLGVYSPMKSEVDWRLMKPEIAKSWELAFPSFCEDSGMVFRSDEFGIEDNSEFGVSLGVPSRNARVLVPDICLIPGLGFSPKGERLGRGKGFYDRFLQSFSGLKIGLGFSEQVRDEIPTEAHDVLLDMVVDETKVHRPT